MFRNRETIVQWLVVSAWIVVLTLLMFGVYGLIGKFSMDVLKGGAVGAVLSSINFLSLSIVVTHAADKVEETGNVGKAQLFVQSSSLVRRVILAVFYIIILKFSPCDPIAAILPLVFVQLGITLMEFFRKDGVIKK